MPEVQPEELVASESGQNRAPNRLSGQGGEVIDRSAIIHFSFNGKSYSAHPGDTIASALTAAGVQVLSRSFKYHRPRGLLCGAGHCPNCLVQVGDEPSVRACQRPVEEGMEVQPQNAWPSLDNDLLSLNQLVSRFMPVGFYYKTFIRPQALWPFYEEVLRRAAGLGKVDLDTPWGEFDKQYLHADVVVVGGGPAGISAALSAASQGAQVLLFDENSAPGGHLRFASGDAHLGALLGDLEQHPRIEIFTDTAVAGWYQDNWLAAVRGSRLFKIRAQSLVVATGAYERPLLFDDNDLPGVMLGSAVQRLIHLFGATPGKRAVVATANDDGWRVAADLLAAGVEVAAVVDERPSGAVPKGIDGVPVLYEHAILAARGAGAVRSAVVAPVDAGGRIDAARRQKFDCDLIAISAGWTPAADLAYMAGGKSVYDEEWAEMRLQELPPGFYLAGRVSGTHGVEVQLEEGRLAGLAAAAFCGRGCAPEAAEITALEGRKTAENRRTSERVCAAGKKKRFLCYCEDVTDHDLETALAEGYDSMELLKRYSTISMGPCQGKMCSMNALHLCANARGQTVQETGRTTSRPPTTPVSLGALAGQHMEPVQRTPIHNWHQERGAKMMVAGLWLRPERYGDPQAEVQAVRRGVGLIDVSTLGKIQLSGPGVADLLERVYVNQWRKLGVGRVRYGVMCNDEGVVLDDGVCAHTKKEEWYMSTTSSGASGIFEWIQWWAQSGWGEGVHLTDLTDVYCAFNLSGPQSRAVLQKLTERDLANEAFPYMRVRAARVAGAPCQLLRIGFTGELSYEVHCPSAYALHVWEALMEAGAEFDIVPFGVEAQRILRLEKAHIIVGQDTDAMTDPLAADMASAVKLDKSDFLGKRELVRVAAAGPKQRLVGFIMVRDDEVPEEGLQIVERGANGKMKIIGWVTSSRFSPTLQKAIGLCWLPVEVAAAAGNSFTIYRQGRLVQARVHHGAFYDPEGERLNI
jgi:sarcosine oxidase subunit alpha